MNFKNESVTTVEFGSSAAAPGGQSPPEGPPPGAEPPDPRYRYTLPHSLTINRIGPHRTTPDRTGPSQTQPLDHKEGLPHPQLLI